MGPGTSCTGFFLINAEFISGLSLCHRFSLTESEKQTNAPIGALEFKLPALLEKPTDLPANRRTDRQASKESFTFNKFQHIYEGIVVYRSVESVNPF